MLHLLNVAFCSPAVPSCCKQEEQLLQHAHKNVEHGDIWATEGAC